MTKMKDDLVNRVQSKLDELTDNIKSNAHLSDPNKTIEIIKYLSKYWTILDDEDRDYVDYAIWMLEEKIQYTE